MVWWEWKSLLSCSTFGGRSEEFSKIPQSNLSFSHKPRGNTPLENIYGGNKQEWLICYSTAKKKDAKSYTVIQLRTQDSNLSGFRLSLLWNVKCDSVSCTWMATHSSGRQSSHGSRRPPSTFRKALRSNPKHLLLRETAQLLQHPAHRSLHAHLLRREWTACKKMTEQTNMGGRSTDNIMP